MRNFTNKLLSFGIILSISVTSLFPMSLSAMASEVDSSTDNVWCLPETDEQIGGDIYNMSDDLDAGSESASDNDIVENEGNCHEMMSNWLENNSGDNLFNERPDSIYDSEATSDDDYNQAEEENNIAEEESSAEKPETTETDDENAIAVEKGNNVEIVRSCPPPVTKSSSSKDDFSFIEEGFSEKLKKETLDRLYNNSNANIKILDADVTVKFDKDNIVIHEDESMDIYAYVWVFFDYDDLSNNDENSDTSGYGTYHKLTFEKTESGYELLQDEFDESDLFGISEISDDTRNEMEELQYLPDLNGDEAEAEDISEPSVDTDIQINRNSDTPAILKASGYSGYNPDAAANYADRYALNYNPDYGNYSSVGGDCSNYCSQCLFAGGLPMVYGSSGSRNSWYYRSYSDRSGTWTMAPWLCDWMAANRGELKVANSGNVRKGNPVFYCDDHRHAAVCVGTNSAGTPIINSHTSDRYHVSWNYWSTNIYTILINTGSGSQTPITPSVTVNEYYDTNLEITMTNTVELYRNPTDSTRVTYFSAGKKAYSMRAANLSNGQTCYEVTALYQGNETKFWIKSDGSRMTIRTIPILNNISLSTDHLDLYPTMEGTVDVDYKAIGLHKIICYIDDASIIVPGQGLNVDYHSMKASISVKGLKPGNAKVIIYFLDDDDKAFASKSFSVTVKDFMISFTPSNVCINKGETQDISIAFSGGGISTADAKLDNQAIADASVKEAITWAPIGKQCKAKISVKGKTAGTTNLTFMLYDKNKSILKKQSMKIVVIEPNITFTPSSYNINEGESKDLSIGFVGNGISTVKCKISDENVLSSTIKENVAWKAAGQTCTAKLRITGKKPGTASLTFYLLNSSSGIIKQRSISIKVASKTLSVNFDPNGGSTETQKKSVTKGGTYGSLPTPQRTGYSFDGWYTTKIGGNQVVSSTKVTAVSDHILYAHWSRTTTYCQITFDSNGGSGSMSPVLVEKGTTYSVPGCTFFPPEGKTFDCWSIDGFRYVPHSDLKINSNIRIYAQWKDKSAENAEVSVGMDKGELGSVISIPVMINNNPGISDLAFVIDYDKDKLVLVSVDRGEVFSKGSFSVNTDTATVKWSSEDAVVVSDDGELFTMQFRIKETQTEIIPVRLGLSNGDEENSDNQDREKFDADLMDGGVMTSDQQDVDNADSEKNDQTFEDKNNDDERNNDHESNNGGEKDKIDRDMARKNDISEVSSNIIRSVPGNKISFDSIQDGDTIILVKGGNYLAEHLVLMETTESKKLINVIKKRGCIVPKRAGRTIVTIVGKGNEKKTITVVVEKVSKATYNTKGNTKVTMDRLFRGLSEVMPDIHNEKYDIKISKVKGKNIDRSQIETNFTSVSPNMIDGKGMKDLWISISGNDIRGDVIVTGRFGGKNYKKRIKVKG